MPPLRADRCALTEGARFRNVDLDLRRSKGLPALLEALQPALFVLHAEPRWARLELAREVRRGGESARLHATLAGLLDALDAAPEPLRERATLLLSIGIDAAPGRETSVRVAAPLLARAARLGALLEAVVYPAAG